MYDLTDPPLDFHPARQLRSALITRAVFYQLDAHADPYVRQQATNLADLEVYEPPILEALVGFADHLVGQENFWMGRIFNALFWVIGGLALYALGRRYASFYAVLLALAFYFFLPFSVIASRSFQPDPWMVMWILWFAYALCRWAEQPGWKWALISGALGGVAVLVKLVAIYFVGGMLGAALLAYWGLRLVRQRQAWAMLALVLAPALIYYGLFNAQRSAGFFSFWTVSLSRLVLTSNFYADWLSMANSLVGLTNFMAALLGVALAARTIGRCWRAGGSVWPVRADVPLPIRYPRVLSPATGGADCAFVAAAVGRAAAQTCRAGLAVAGGGGGRTPVCFLLFRLGITFGAVRRQLYPGTSQLGARGSGDPGGAFIRGPHRRLWHAPALLWLAQRLGFLALFG